MVSKIKSFLLYEGMQKEPIDCSICGSKNYIKIFDRNDYEMSIDMTICKHCGFLFTNPRPTQQEINEYYEKTYRKSATDLIEDPREYKDNSKARRRAEWLYGVVKPLLEERCIQTPWILDVGCGLGTVLHIFRKYMPRCRLYGVDLSPSSAKYAMEKNNAIVFTGDMASFHDENKHLFGSFHLIILLHVLEHLYYPVEKLAKLRDFLAPGGLLLVQVPTPFSPECTKVSSMFHIAHVNQFHPRTLEYAFRRAGFSEIKECVSSPSVITYLGCKADSPLSKEEIPAMDEQEFLSLSRSIQEKISNEYRSKNSLRKTPIKKVLDKIFVGLSRMQNEAKLEKLISNQTVWILGPELSQTEIEKIPLSAKIFASNRAIRFFAAGKIQRDIDLYLCVRSLIKPKKYVKSLSELAKVKAQFVLTDNVRFIIRTKRDRKNFSRLVYDNGVDDYYLKRLFDTAGLNSVKSRADRVISAELRLLQYALYFGAKEVCLAGIDFGDKGTLWGENRPDWQSADLDKEFILLVSKKYRNVYGISNESPLANYLPRKIMDEPAATQEIQTV